MKYAYFIFLKEPINQQVNINLENIHAHKHFLYAYNSYKVIAIKLWNDRRRHPEAIVYNRSVTPQDHLPAFARTPVVITPRTHNQSLLIMAEIKECNCNT